MSGQHTPMRMESRGTMVYVGHEGGIDLRRFHSPEEFARRLASCWNACFFLTQDHFDGGWTARGLSKYAKSLEDGIKAARTALATAEQLLSERDKRIADLEQILADLPDTEGGSCD